VFVAASIVASLMAREEYASSLLALSLGLAFFLLLHYAFFSAKAAAASRVVVERRIKLVGGGDSKVRVRVRVTNPSMMPLELLVVRDKPPSSLGGGEGAVLAFSLPPRGSGEAAYFLDARVGRHSWGDAGVELIDVIGLFRARAWSVESRGERHVLVPPLVRVEVLRRAARVVGEAFTSGTALRRGVAGSFLGLRDYVPEDDSRLIDWKSSARLGRLMVKVFEQEYGSTTLLLFDVTSSSLVGGPGHTWAEAAARALASLALVLLTNGARVGVAALSPSATLYYSGIVGSRGDRARLFSAIARAVDYAEAAAEDGLAAARKLVARVAARAKASSIILASDLGRGSLEEYLEFARPLREMVRGRIILLCTPPPIPRNGNPYIRRFYEARERSVEARLKRFSSLIGARLVCVRGAEGVARLVAGLP